MSATTKNSKTLPLSDISQLTYEEYAEAVTNGIQKGGTLLASMVDPVSDSKQASLHDLFTVISYPDRTIGVFRTRIGSHFPSLTPNYPQFHLFEREIAEQHGLIADGHPWLKPVRFHQVQSGGIDAWGRDPNTHPLVGEMEYFQVSGDEIHEVGVGPVHAGVIEPGHFRFQCFGEKVLHLEISLGYQHRGLESGLVEAPSPRSMARIETMAGDTTIGHATAHCRLIEGIAGTHIPPRAVALRAVALELERLANHVGDIGAMAGDIGYLPTASFCGRLRGDYLNMTAQICGSRFGRGLVRPGGLLFDTDQKMVDELLTGLTEITKQTKGAIKLFFNAPSVLSRLDHTGTVSLQDGLDLGLTGVAGRACGINCDVRRLYPLGKEKNHFHPEILRQKGDVLARAQVRRLEIEASLDFIKNTLADLPKGQIITPLEKQPAGDSIIISLVEGWRGRIAHLGLTDPKGLLRRYKVIDPSFFNWSGLAMALRNEQISDFPLCNKSFNLSYCGVDL
ncbi:MAG: hydrogenase [Desulfobulbaceae bacterium]|nr:hydrogenase [Desulfobulbaceae bacterium]